MRQNKPIYKIIVNRSISSQRSNQDQEETEQLPIINPKSIARVSKKNFEIKKVKIKVAIQEEKIELNLRLGKLDPIQKEKSSPLSEKRQSKTQIDQKLNEVNNRSISTIKKEKSYHQKYEIDENLEDNLDKYIKIYYSLINLMDAMKKSRIFVIQLIKQIDFMKLLMVCILKHQRNLCLKIARNLDKYQYQQNWDFFDQHVQITNNVNFRNLLIFNLQNYLFLGEMIIQKTQNQELMTIIMQNKKYFGSKKIESSTQIRQNIELLQGLYKQLTKQSKDLNQFLNQQFRLIANIKIVESNLMIQDFTSLYFTIQQSYYGLLGIPLISVAHKPYLPNKASHNLTLILDMDETLIHFVDQTKSFIVRPYAEQFLEEMSKYYEIAIFTAGLPDYANWVLNQVVFNKYIQYRLYRQHAMQYQKHFIKDLSRLGRCLTKCIIIDNIAENYQHQEENGIQIKTWYNDPDDKELLHLSVLLRRIAEENCEDVRDALKQYKNNVQVC
ncbi:unnamed protein product [Paramecium sonneborni]|uniref:Mitochondrial import inner membrane translocase subunit TIM50 n=1 Tax=Paramecium sonneborni TaxID=65129 RepID=A0A8S1L6T6_9CILI|nr:unnamed protein product [Paramecium sonneborni]